MTPSIVRLVLLLFPPLGPLGCVWQPPFEATRADVAAVYMQFEQAYAAMPPESPELARVNRDFDAAAIRFFAGDLSAAIREIKDLVFRLGMDSPPNTNDALRGALSLRIDPPVYIRDSASSIRVSCVSNYVVPEGLRGRFDAVIRVINPLGEIVFERSFAIEVGFYALPFLPLVVDLPSESLPSGLYRVELRDPASKVLDSRSWAVVARSLDAAREQNLSRLNRIEATPALDQAITACRARNNVLRNRPSQRESIQFLSDLSELAVEVDREIAALEAGQNPYRRRPGTTWRVVDAAGVTIPIVIYSPPIVTTAVDEPRPLIVALHGAGGDELQFLQAYGQGLIRRLADEHGFIVAMPLTNPIIMQPALFAHLLRVLTDDYPIDSQRTYLLGHSLGGIATALLAGEFPDAVRAGVCIAGFSARPGVTRTAPLLVFAGGVDPISSAETLRQRVDVAVADGLEVEFRRVENFGHTLLVDHVLPEAVRWLLEK